MTLGTPPATNDPAPHSLLPSHNYAILGLPIYLPLRSSSSLTDYQPTAFQDMQDDGSERYITLFDPWRNREPRAQMKSPSKKMENETRNSCEASRPYYQPYLLVGSSNMKFDSISAPYLEGYLRAIRYRPPKLGPIVVFSAPLYSWVGFHARNLILFTRKL